MKILANDGISTAGIETLESNGFEVITTKVAQEQIANYINTNNVTALLVRSATKVRQDIIDNCPSLKLIARAGIGMENIDVDHARSKGIQVLNTPESSTESVDENVENAEIKVEFYNGQSINIEIETESIEELLKHSDFITLHVPAEDDYLI